MHASSWMPFWYSKLAGLLGYLHAEGSRTIHKGSEWHGKTTSDNGNIQKDSIFNAWVRLWLMSTDVIFIEGPKSQYFIEGQPESVFQQGQQQSVFHRGPARVSRVERQMQMAWLMRCQRFLKRKWKGGSCISSGHASLRFTWQICQLCNNRTTASQVQSSSPWRARPFVTTQSEISSVTYQSWAFWVKKRNGEDHEVEEKVWNWKDTVEWPLRRLTERYFCQLGWIGDGQKGLTMWNAIQKMMAGKDEQWAVQLKWKAREQHRWTQHWAEITNSTNGWLNYQHSNWKDEQHW